MNRNAIRWFEIYVQDMARARAFYEGVLQVTLQRLPDPNIEMWTFAGDPNQPGAAGALVKMEGVPSGGNSTLVYFSSSDCAIEEGRTVAQGGRVYRPKMSIGEYGAISLIIDTEGNMFGLHSL